MKHISLSVIALVGLLAFSTMGVKAQSVVGQRDYFESVGGARASANTISHYVFNKPTTVFVDPSRRMSVQMNGDVVALRTLLGVNKYKLGNGGLVYNNLFMFAYEAYEMNEDWQYCIPFAFCSRDKDGNLVAEQFYILKWSAPKLDLELPTEADVEYYEMTDGKKGKVKNYHAQVTFGPKSVTIGEEELECVQLFADKMLAKQFDKSYKMLTKYLSAKKGSAEDVIEGVSLAPSLMEY